MLCKPHKHQSASMRGREPVPAQRALQEDIEVPDYSPSGRPEGSNADIIWWLNFGLDE
jgi:hypothetical protein